MNGIVTHNFSKVRLSFFVLPVLLLLAIVMFLFFSNALHVEQYVSIQKESFLYINSKLSQFPQVIYNLTQIGDELIFFSFLIFFITDVPKLFESLISASLVSALFSIVLKKLFSVPRPAAMFDHDSFTIIGHTLSGNNSLPSGHSITVFTFLSVLLWAFLPQQNRNKIFWVISILIVGVMIVFTRVGVGAHYPLDVIIGSIIGYISGLTGILLNQHINVWSWISEKKSYPIFILLMMIGAGLLVTKVIHEGLVIFYLSICCMLLSIFKMITLYVKK